MDAPGLSNTLCLQAGPAAATAGPGCPESPSPISVLPGILILCKQSWSIVCVLDSLSQQRNSSSTFIFRTGCRTLPGGISEARPLLPEEAPARRQVPESGLRGSRRCWPDCGAGQRSGTRVPGADGAPLEGVAGLGSGPRWEGGTAAGPTTVHSSFKTGAPASLPKKVAYVARHRDAWRHQGAHAVADAFESSDDGELPGLAGMWWGRGEDWWGRGAFRSRDEDKDEAW